MREPLIKTGPGNSGNREYEREVYVPSRATFVIIGICCVLAIAAAYGILKG